MNIVNGILHYITKTAVIIPLFGLLIVLCYIQSVRLSEQEIANKKPVVTPKPIAAQQAFAPNNARQQPSASGTKRSIKIDINGSYICKTASMSAYIKNKQVRATNTNATSTEEFLFNGDCVYAWLKGQKTGTNSCGYGQYLAVYEMFGGSIDLNTILPYMGSFQKTVGSSEGLLSITQSCKPDTTIADSVFVLPKNITFSSSK